MSKTSKFERCLIPVYIVIEGCFLAAIKITEFTAPMSVVRIIRYAAIIVNTIVALYFFFVHGRKAFAGGSADQNVGREAARHENLVCLALVITLFADFFLTLLGGVLYGTIGVAIFCILESVYAVYLKSPLPSIIARVVLFVALIVAALAFHHLTITTGAAVLNISILTVNLIDAWSAKRFDAGLLFKIGITLFFVGDLCVGLREVTSGGVKEVAAFLVWIFYLPTQVLLTLHYTRKEIEKT